MASFTVYQDTWQGNQLQYTTPRTNKLTYSDDFTQTAWTATTGVTTTAAGITGPDGNTSAGTLVYAGTVGSSGGVRISQSLDIPANGTLAVCSIWLKAAGALSLRMNCGFGFTTLSVTTSWQLFQAPGTADGVSHIELAIASPAATNTAFTVDYAFAQVEEGTLSATSYIPTTTGPVTVTDYSFNGPMTEITFSVAPIVASVITGEYPDTTTFSIGTGDGTTVTFSVPAPTTGPLPIPTNIYSDGVPYHAFAITPNNTVDLTVCTLKIYIGGSGALKVNMNRDTSPVTFQVVAHTFYDLAVSRVYATGTTATGIIGLN